MWRHLGGGSHDEDDSDDGRSGGGLWSRFKQVASEVVDDLAQPQWSEGEDEDAEDAQWEDLAEEEALYDEGEGEQVEAAEEVVDAWIGDEEVDFVADEGQPEGYLYEEEGYPPPEGAFEQQQPLFQQRVVQEDTAEAADDWDLNDEDLGMPEEEIYEDQPMNDDQDYLEQQPQYAEDELLAENLAEEDDFGANAWGQDDSLNLDDSHDVGVQETLSAAQGIAGRQSHDNYDKAAQQNDASGWSDDLGIPDDQDVVRDGESADQGRLLPADDDADQNENEADLWDEDLQFSENNLGPLHQATETGALKDNSGITADADRGDDNGDAWVDDDLDLSDQQEEAQIAQPIQTTVFKATDLNASADADTGDAPGNDDLNLSDQQEEAEMAQPIQTTEFNATDLNASASADTGDAWDNDDLDLSDQQDEAQSAPPIQSEKNATNLNASVNADTGDAWDTDDLNLTDQEEEARNAQPIQSETNATNLNTSANADTGGAWDHDDLNLSDQQEESQSAQPLQTEAVGTDLNASGNLHTGDAWDNDDLNLSDHQGETQPAQPIQTEFNATDLDASADADTGDAWVEDDLNLSDHQEETQTAQPIRSETNGTDINVSADAATGDAWKNDDLNLSDHQEETQIPQPIQSETNATDLNVSANVDTGDAWDNDDLNLSKHQEGAQADQPVQTEAIGTDLDASANVDTGDAWDNDDLNLSDHHEETQTIQTIQSERSATDLDASADAGRHDAWDNDNLNLSDHQEDPHTAQPIQIERSAADNNACNDDEGQPTQLFETETSVDEHAAKTMVENDDAWDNDDLNLSEHDEGQFKRTIEAADDARQNSEPNLNEHQEVTQPLQPMEDNSAIASATDRLDAGAAWYADLNLSAPLQEKQVAETVTPSTVLGAGVSQDDTWDNVAGLNSGNLDEQTAEPTPLVSDLLPSDVDGSEEQLGAWGDHHNFEQAPGASAEHVVDSHAEITPAAASVDHGDNAWGDSEFIVDDDNEYASAVGFLQEGEMQSSVLQMRGHHEDDDSTVEQSNTAGGDVSVEGNEMESIDELSRPNLDQSSTELHFGSSGRTSARRATLRASNTSSAVSRMGSVEEKGVQNAKIVGTSVMFAETGVSDEGAQKSPEKTDDLKEPSPGSGISGVSMTSNEPPDQENTKDEEGNAARRAIRDNVSSVSEDDSNNGSMPLLQTQISMMTLKSVADSCPSTRQRDNDSDEDDEDDFGPVVDKTPEVSSVQDPPPALSTMTINSTAVAAHSVNEDIQQDEDMDGTYYGGSTTDGGPSAENAWDEDDGSSLEGLDDLEEKIVNFELPETEDHHPSPQGEAQPPDARKGEKAVDSSPRLNSSMANVYSDDNSVPSRDNDDDDEDVYKPVVDQVPKPVKLESGTTLNSMAVVAGNSETGDSGTDTKQDEETVGVMTGGTPTDKNLEADDVNGWGDNESLDGLSEEGVGEKETTSVAPQEAAHVVVDNTPAGERSEAGSLDKGGGSLAAVESADNSYHSRVHDSDEEQYGLVVDQIPDSPPPLIDQVSVAASSMAVATHNADEDLKQDEDTDASGHGGSTVDEIGGSEWDVDLPRLEDVEVGGGDGNNNPEQSQAEAPSSGNLLPEGGADGSMLEADRVVDLTPKMQPKITTRFSSNSLAVMAHSVNQDFEEEESEEEDGANFGPIVDITPNPQRHQPVTPGSTAVLAAQLKEDYKQDETTEVGIGDVNWDEEFPELGDIQSREEDQVEETSSQRSNDEISQPPAFSQQKNDGEVVLVDHTPEGESLRKKPRADASLAVLAPSEDGTCPSINDEEDTVNDIDPHGEHVSYGPVVDMTPTLSMQRAAAPSTAPSVTFSLAVEACSVDEDIKQDEEMDETLGGDTTTCGGGVETGWDEDTNALDDLSRHSEPYGFRLPPMINQFESPQSRILVDHTPQLGTTRSRVADASIATLAPSQASTYHSEDDENDNDTITNDEDVYGRVVDHTPRLAPIPLVTSNSMAVGASSTDYRSEMERDEDMDNTYFGDSADEMNGWEEDDEALEGIDTKEQVPSTQGADDNLVDHTPTPETRPKPKDPSVAVLAPSVDSSSVAEDDNDSQDERHVFGPVVDVTPEQPSGSATITGSLAVEAHSLAEDIRRDEEMDGTMFGDSTSAGGGWDEDEAALEDLAAEEKEAALAVGGPASSNIWQSTSDNNSSRMEGSTSAERASQDGVILVDHTPSEIDSSMPKNTVGWLPNVESGISGDNDADDMDGDWAQDDHALDDEAVLEQGTEEDQVVDRVPQRPESRFGDASTLVVADPSEVLSHVDDMLQEEGNFGPVVDQTPPSHPAVLHALSGAGSTAVVAPTVVHDELDDGDESANDEVVNDGGNGDGWDPDPPELEQAPNPQSGNEEDTTPRVREQVVDFIPPQEGAAERNRAGWSEVTTGGVPSVLQVDPKEDEFGPVVDQLPLPQPSTPFSAISTASQVASSECEALAVEDEAEEAESKQEKDASNVVVDPLPRPFEVGSAMQNLDSTASLIQSSTSDDDDDDDDDDATGKYGPVVDHLPSVRSSLPPSRGGSTVDALATVSEVNDNDGDSSDDGGNDGWDDDLGEIDLAEDHAAVSSPVSNTGLATEPAELQNGEEKSQADKSMTVRFRSVVAAIFEPGSSENTEDLNRENHAEGSDTEEANAWDDDLDFDEAFDTDADGQPLVTNSDRYDHQFAEADTPPATPYSHPKSANYNMEADQDLPDGVTLPDFGSSYAMGPDMCECATATTIDCPCVQRILKNGVNGNDSVKIDYQMLLQTEISKRRLVEEESKDLRAQLEALKESKSAGEVNMETVQTLQNYVQGVEANLSDIRHECESLRNQNKELQTSLSEAQRETAEMTDREDRWKLKELELREEHERKEKDLKDSLSELEKHLKTKEKDLLAEVGEREEAAQKLSDQIGSLQTECSALRESNDTLTIDLNALRETLTQRDEELESVRSKELVRDQEVQKLNDTIKQMQQENNSIAPLREEVNELQKQLASKDSDCENLNTKIICLQEQLQAGEGQQYANGQHEEEKMRLEEQLVSLRAQIEETESLREEESVSKWKLQELESEVKRLSEEKEVLMEELREAQTNGENSRNELETTLDQRNRELQAASAEVSELKKQNDSLAAEIAKQRSGLQSTELLESQLHSVSDERDSLRNALTESDETIQGLRLRIEEQGTEESVIEEKRNKEIESLRSQLTSLRNVIAANKKQIEALQKKIDRITGENQTLQDTVAEWRLKCTTLDEEMESARLDAARDESSQGQLTRELESLRSEVASFAAEREEAKKDRDNLLRQCKEVESSLNKAMRDSESNAEKTAELQNLLSKAEADLDCLRQESEAASNERDQYREKCNAIEQSLAAASESSQEASRLTAVNASMSSEVQRLQQELEKQHSFLRDSEARVAALEEDLSSERQSSVEKDQDLAELQRQLEVTLAHLEESSTGQSDLPERIAELETCVANLEAERSEHEERLALYASKEQELHEISESLSQDRERAVGERDALSEENEEMLVHFGYLNEQLDSYDQQIQELQSLADKYKHESATGEAQVRELQHRLEAAESTRQENGEHHASLQAQTEAELASLRQERHELVENLNELTAVNAEKDSRIQSITQELEALQSQLEELKHARTDAEADATENNRLRSQVKELESLRDELNERCSDQDEEVSRLSNIFDASQYTSSALQSRVEALEKACSERDRNLQQKDTEMQDLMNRLHEARGESEESQEMVMLRERLNQMEHRAIEMSDRANEMEHNYRTSQGELQSTSGKLSAMEDTVADLQRQISAQDEAARDAADKEALIYELENKLQNNSNTISELSQENSGLSNEVSNLKSQLEVEQEETRLKSLDADRLFDENKSLRAQLEAIQERETSSQQLVELENKLQSKSKTIAELTQENSALSNELSNLKSQFEKDQAQAHHTSMEEDKRMKDKIESLKEQLNAVNLKLESSTEQHKAQEESLNADLKKLQHKLASKDGEVMMMKHKLENAKRDLQTSRGETQSSEEVVKRMSLEMESLREQQKHVFQGRSSTAAKLLEQSKENAEDVDNLRLSVISLASALETSESRRADAIDRLLKERQTHAESLRRLADSVKRFYATVSCSEK